MNQTIDYYNNKAQDFALGTQNVDFSETRSKFLAQLKSGASILDLGCGSGRDSKAFMDLGYEITPCDGSRELCKLASNYLGLPVRQMLFLELADEEAYDGVWACASILHCKKEELKQVLEKISAALKKQGVCYTSFKYGDFEGERDGRYFVDFTLESFEEFLQDVKGLALMEAWVSQDVRPGREEEKWVNVLLRKV